MQTVNFVLAGLAVYSPVAIVSFAVVVVVASFWWVFGPGRRSRRSRGPARTWIVDQDEDLAGLEQRLNYLDEHGFRPHQVVAWQGPAFLIVAVRSRR